MYQVELVWNNRTIKIPIQKIINFFKKINQSIKQFKEAKKFLRKQWWKLHKITVIMINKE